MRVALIHDWLTGMRGGEKVLEALLDIFPDAEIFTFIYNKARISEKIRKVKINTSFLQIIPGIFNFYRNFLPLFPCAIENFSLKGFDLIISSSHCVAKGVKVPTGVKHICYCHTPMRFAWDLTFDYLRGSVMGRGAQGVLTRYLLHRMRQWDVLTANRVDYFIANSQTVADRIWRCYRRPATVIYPPVNIERFSPVTAKQDFYLTVSRLVSYKRVSLIVKAFNQLQKPLVVIGSGPELSRIRKLAQPNVQVLGGQPDAVVEKYMAEAKAFVYAACEDFGIAVVEAQACGTPVIAYGAGGALETVRDIHQHPDTGTGLFFFTQTEAALVEAVEKFEAHQGAFNPEYASTHAAQFDRKTFRERYLSFLENSWQKFRSRHLGAQRVITRKHWN